MPELPEVETIRRQLNKEISGYRITGLKADAGKTFSPSVGEVRKLITGLKIEKVDRLAKVLILTLADHSHLLFHLKMTGRLLVRPPTTSADKYVRAVFALTAGKKRLELRFADARKFGYVRLLKTGPELLKLRLNYGPEPLKDLTLNNFRQILSVSRRPVKTTLLDQSKISGVGNIYANDALWLARINPSSPSNKITDARVVKLYKALLTVLKRGLRYGGASDNSYVQIHGEAGSYQKHFLVYKRTKEPCLKCKTLVQRSVVGGRGTFFCPRCQQ